MILIVLVACGFADEDDFEQSWPSPDGRFLLQHTANYNHRRIPLEKKEDQYDQGAAYTLTRQGRLLWGVASPVDESANSFRCVWSADSRAALILDRPARGDVQMWLVLTTRPEKSRALPVQAMIDRVEAWANDDNWRNLQKAWFGEWRWGHGRFEGILLATKSRYYQLHLVVDPTARKPRLTLVDSRPAEKWDEALEAW